MRRDVRAEVLAIGRVYESHTTGDLWTLLHADRASEAVTSPLLLLTSRVICLHAEANQYQQGCCKGTCAKAACAGWIVILQFKAQPVFGASDSEHGSCNFMQLNADTEVELGQMLRVQSEFVKVACTTLRFSLKKTDCGCGTTCE